MIYHTMKYLTGHTSGCFKVIVVTMLISSTLKNDSSSENLAISARKASINTGSLVQVCEYDNVSSP